MTTMQSEYGAVPLSTLTRQLRGVSYNKSEASSVASPGTVPILRAGNITDTGLHFDDLVYVPTERVSEIQYLKKDDIVIAASSGSIDVVGKAARLNQDWRGAFGAFCKVLRPNGGVAPQYLEYFLQTPYYRRTISHLAGGANINNIRNEHLDNLEIPLPPLEEQKRIAAILDKADALRRKRAQALQLTDQFLQSLFLDMFGDPVTNPKGHQYEDLGNHLEFVTSGGRGWARYYSETGSRFVRSLDVQMNHIPDEDAVFVAPPDNAEARRTQIAEGDVLLTITGSRIGRVSAVPKELEGGYISQHVAIIRVNKSRLNPDFLSFFLSIPNGGQRQIAKMQYGQTKPGLNFDQIRRFKVPVPDLDFQEAFLVQASRMNAVAKKQTLFSKDCEDLTASLTQRAFQGELQP